MIGVFVDTFVAVRDHDRAGGHQCHCTATPAQSASAFASAPAGAGPTASAASIGLDKTNMAQAGLRLRASATGLRQRVRRHLPAVLRLLDHHQLEPVRPSMNVRLPVRHEGRSWPIP